jgi:hypothetical protein
MLTFGISASSRSAISEVELDRLLDAVRKAIESVPQDFLSGRPIFDQPPEHGNDNGLEWPLVPFPEGWDGPLSSPPRLWEGRWCVAGIGSCQAAPLAENESLPGF